MEAKYTKSGKKVVVLGKLNNESWIVQEVFIANGIEFPSGENFVETTLLDVPAETWVSREAKKLEDRKKQLEKEIEEIRGKCQIVKRTSDIAKLINGVTERYQNIDVTQLDILFKFMAGRITHVVAEKYDSYEIISLSDAIKSEDNYWQRNSLEGLKLVSLFGVDEYGKRNEEKSLRLDWRISQYRDGSGSFGRNIHPCESYEKAVGLVESLISGLDANDDLIKLKKQHGLNNPSAEKIKEYYLKISKDRKLSLEKEKARLEVIQNEINELEKLAV